MHVYDNQKLYDALKDLAVIEPKQLDAAFAAGKEEHRPLGDILVEKDLLSYDHIGQIIADLLSLPFITLSTLVIPEEILNLIPEAAARKQKIIAFAKDGNIVSIATANPGNTQIRDFITKKTGNNLKLFYATEQDIADTLRLYERDLQKTFEEIVRQQTADTQTTINEVPAKIVDLMIQYAYENKASDIHIEPKEELSLIRFRIDGVLHTVLQLPKNLHSLVVTRVKILAKLRTDEHFSAQDGKIQLMIDEEELDIRVSIMPVIKGEKIVMRLLSSRSRQFSLNDLGMTETDLERVRKGFAKPFGMVLSTGPTGSGKTTSIYAIVKILNSKEKNISTIEDPVEYYLESINQSQVNPRTNITFADGLRAMLRQDPDIIFVGEIRDNDTADIAVKSAMTGHLVLSTLHTNDAATALPRLIDMNIEPFLVASTVNVIIGQRLVRTICNKCRVSSSMSVASLEKLLSQALVKKYFGTKKTVTVYQGKGCTVCHKTGYSGRIGIFEVLELTEKIKELITAKAAADVIQKQAVKEGMTTMLENGLEKVVNGVTTIDEVLRATKL